MSIYESFSSKYQYWVYFDKDVPGLGITHRNRCAQVDYNHATRYRNTLLKSPEFSNITIEPIDKKSSVV